MMMKSTLIMAATGTLFLTACVDPGAYPNDPNAQPEGLGQAVRDGIRQIFGLGDPAKRVPPPPQPQQPAQAPPPAP